jgi:hypothetical protein
MMQDIEKDMEMVMREMEEVAKEIDDKLG